MLYLGDDTVRARVNQAISELEDSLDGQILHRFEPEDPGLYRNGVTEVPKGAVAGFYEPGNRGSTFLADEK